MSTDLAQLVDLFDGWGSEAAIASTTAIIGIIHESTRMGTNR